MEHILTIERAQANRGEKDGFIIERSRGFSSSVFLHFINSVEILVDGKMVLAPPDSVIVYEPQTPQYFRSIGPLSHDWMHVSGPVCEAMEEFGLHPDRLYCGHGGAHISRIVQEIENELAFPGTFSQALISADCSRLFIEIARSYAPDSSLSRSQRVSAATQELSLRTIRSTLLSNPGRDWDLAELADMASLSVSRFSAVYRQMFSISPIDDLIRARIETAEKRLLDTRLSVQELAVNLGYKSSSHFCRQFKRFTGMTPGSYRSLHRADAQEPPTFAKTP